MEIINDIIENKKEIVKCTKQHGHVREHNFWYLFNQQTSYSRGCFLKFDGNCGLMSIRYKSGLWEIVGDAIAPEEKRLELIRDFLEFVLIKKRDKKVFVNAPEKFYNEIISILQESGKYRVTMPPMIYYNPVFKMKQWDENLRGGRWKKLRNIMNKFSKFDNFEILPSKDIEKDKLLQVVLRWRKYRPRINKTYYTQMYINFIRNDFEGTDIARTVVINGEPCCITAGWHIPNSKNYYSAIGLYNYKYNGLAEVANVDDLNRIKEEDYEYSDFGDSGESLLQFKKKFGPSYFYRTHWFYIVKR